MLMGQKLLLLDTRTLIFSWQSKKVSPEGPKCDEMRGVLGNPKGWGSPKTILWCVDRASPSSGLPCQSRVRCFRCAFWATISYLLRAGGGSLWVAVFRVIRGENNPCLADCLQSAALHWKNTFLLFLWQLPWVPHHTSETKEQMPPPKPAEAGTRNEVFLTVQLEGVREESGSFVTTATGIFPGKGGSCPK